MADWPISQRLRDYLGVQYELRRVLGEGGMGVVLLATERVLDRPVAIKVLHRHAAEQPELRERFRREARVAARLTHANIVPLHTFGDIDGELFFVMGFVEGETLAERLRREGRIPQDEALHILREVCDALALAHANGVIHRDVKPENVLLEARTGRALLADFGIAREGSASASLTGTGIAIGTPHYMSPEQAVSEGTIDHRADIYAVGVLGYRMLTGRLPFDGANVREILARQMVAAPRDFTRDHPEVSPRVAAAVMQCLQKDPEKRWPDIASFRDSIGQRNDAEEELPPELADVEGSMPWIVLGSAFGGWLLALNRLWWHKESFGDLLPDARLRPTGRRRAPVVHNSIEARVEANAFGSVPAAAVLDGLLAPFCPSSRGRLGPPTAPDSTGAVHRVVINCWVRPARSKRAAAGVDTLAPGLGGVSGE